MRSFLVAAGLGWIAAAVPVRGGDDADWPMYNRDVAGWRYNTAEKTLSPANVGGLVEQWRFPPKGADFKIGVVHGTPAVVGGRVYFGTASDPAFYALNADGTLKWAYRNPAYAGEKPQPIIRPTDPASRNTRFQSAPNGVLGSALVTEDSVYFGDIGGWFYCLDREMGKERWKVAARGDKFRGRHPFNAFFSSPILADGKVIVGGGTLEQVIAPVIPLYPASTGRGFVIAFDTKTGKVVWKHDVGPEPRFLSPPVEVTDGWGPHKFAYGPATSSVWCTPSFDAESGTVFFGTDVNTGPRQPTKENPELSTPDSCAVRAINVRDGKLKWNTQLNSGDVWHNGMCGYDVKTGQYKDQSVGDTPKIVTLPVDGAATKCVGVGCKNGGFYLLRAANGKIVRHTPLYKGPPNDPLSPPPDPRTLALPGVIGGLQTGCATDGRSFFTNGVDAIRLGSGDHPFRSAIPPTGGRVTATSLDLLTEHWRHERPKVTLGGPSPKPIFTNAGDPVASGIALANGVAYFTTVGSGKLVAVDLATGKLIKELPLGPVWCGPSVSNGRVYVGSGNTLFNNYDEEAYFPKRFTGTVFCLGLPSSGAPSGTGIRAD